jgi:dynein heavy chain 2
LLNAADRAQLSAKQNNKDSPVASFITLEYQNASKLFRVVENSIRALKEGLLTPATQAVATALLKGRVPHAWSRHWEGPAKPLVWLQQMMRKATALDKWASLGESLLSQPLALDELFNPGTFLNALRQQTARKLGVAIDELQLAAGWDSHRGLPDCEHPITVVGLKLQGAGFKESRLCELAPNAAEFVELEKLSLGFVPKAASAQAFQSDTRHVSVPLYLDSSRQMLLADFDVPVARGDSARWVLAGVALFLSSMDS